MKTPEQKAEHARREAEWRATHPIENAERKQRQRDKMILQRRVMAETLLPPERDDLNTLRAFGYGIKRRCGFCGNVGHLQTTCPAKTGVSTWAD